ncbi:hypothetical protein DA01_02900 [Dehalococcoides mccartyi]|uniref:Uncharacterized protein n=1 Tax=Dehalococcoides mccartyi TaxID=61435 RepID=A0A0V8M4M8_9CHLR|nr:hypothetical protein [Dehalococcoides mccartyi]KSV18481.1 hypothetical protein DA01_02900 [Dehalococcoides mccartyi]
METKTLHFYTKIFYWVALACIPVVFSALFLLYQIRGFPILKLDDNVQSTFILITNIFIFMFLITAERIPKILVKMNLDNANDKSIYTAFLFRLALVITLIMLGFMQAASRDTFIFAVGPLVFGPLILLYFWPTARNWEKLKRELVK